ncbi:Fic family protein [Acidithiobacillus caldus]|uniref:Cell filamentation protein Fic n=2 Tax=Acidithiobacillus caldus TaxID=33059 RepID=A0A1E7Z212_9PROT|nr:Fic family protein [Acidithiobacillus caldus]MBU2770038.1 Fic family protein [Acidithiobacillus caldus]MBU2781983.1 Fic family protein [Acidithiobacillus caldus]OFC62648.1 cell filamentation protein Fic [Acidithiobacillus caldus]
MPSLAGKRRFGTVGSEVLFAQDSAESRRLQRAAAQGLITRIAPGVYVQASPGDPEHVARVVQRHWQKILGRIFPEAVVSHLSAFRGGMTPQGELILSHPTRFNKRMTLPGLVVVLRKGPGPLPGDMPLGDNHLYWASRPRMLLENLKRSSTRLGRTAGRAEVEAFLVRVLQASGEEAMNRIRDDAKHLKETLDAAAEFQILNALIGELLGTHAKGALRTAEGHLVARGIPADSGALHRLGRLADALRGTPLPRFTDAAAQDPARTHFAFLEAYFSNYVEGTRFSIEEAEQIALHNQIVVSRPKDSHDLLGVFHLILDLRFRSSLPSPDDILEGLCERHRRMLDRRPEVTPGEFKMTTNFAGQTEFVNPALVRGTLLEGAKQASGVPEGLARAVFYAFLVSEIHPFNDGNGRLSRLLMNAELSRLGLCRIIIPTLYHEQYVDAQRALTRGTDPVPLIHALSRIAKWTTLFDYTDLGDVVRAMTSAHAFEENARQFQLLGPDGVVFA